MSARFSIIPSRAVDDVDLPAAALRVLCALGTYGDRNGWCRPSLTTLGERLGCSKQAVSKQIRQLVTLGYLEVSSRYRDNGGQSSNLYRIRLDVGDPTSETLFEPEEPDDCVPPVNPGLTPRQPPEVDPPSTQLGLPPPSTPEVDPILERPILSERPNGTRQERGLDFRKNTQLPEGFQPSQNHQALAAELHVDLGSEFAAFTDYHRSKGSTFKDWNAALRTWLRNAKKFSAGRSVPQGRHTSGGQLGYASDEVF